jgi:hypothetical protein
MTPQEIDKIVCDWSMRFGIAMPEAALNDLVDGWLWLPPHLFMWVRRHCSTQSFEMPGTTEIQKMGDSYHLDHEMTKQELQMENRRLRNHLRRILEIATHLDIALSGTNRAIHFQCDAILYEINQACVARSASQPANDAAVAFTEALVNGHAEKAQDASDLERDAELRKAGHKLRPEGQ